MILIGAQFYDETIVRAVELSSPSLLYFSLSRNVEQALQNSQGRKSGALCRSSTPSKIDQLTLREACARNCKANPYTYLRRGVRSNR